MFPYRDENPTVHPSVITIAIIAITSLVWLLFQGAGFGAQLAGSVCEFGVIPSELTGSNQFGAQQVCPAHPGPRYLTLISSIFMHGGWLHLIGNMLFLWVFGNNIEDVMGHGRFVVFYLITGLVAALAQVFINPSSLVPMVGASGAISGVMGAYIVLFPRVRVHTLIFLGIFVTTVSLPAWMMLGYWFVLQLLGSFAGPVGGGGVAFLAHTGGFVAGVALIKLFVVPARMKGRPAPHVLEVRRDQRRRGDWI